MIMYAFNERVTQYTLSSQSYFATYFTLLAYSSGLHFLLTLPAYSSAYIFLLALFAYTYLLFSSGLHLLLTNNDDNNNNNNKFTVINYNYTNL